VFALNPRGVRQAVPQVIQGSDQHEGEQAMTQQIRRLWTDDSGQDMVEYALLLVLLTLVVIVALRILGPTISGFFNNVSNNLNSVSS
jgi:pilus assembly protein Flp/PilA